MRYKKIFLTNDNRTPFSLKNEFNCTFDLEEEIIDCPCGDIAQLARIVNSYAKYSIWRVVRDDDRYTRLSSKDYWGNEHFLICKKGE